MQVNLLTERELTKALRLLLNLHEHYQIKREANPELEAMLKKTDISYIERKLEEQMRSEAPTLPKIVARPITKLASSVKNKKANGRGG